MMTAATQGATTLIWRNESAGGSQGLLSMDRERLGKSSQPGTLQDLTACSMHPQGRDREGMGTLQSLQARPVFAAADVSCFKGWCQGLGNCNMM